MLENLDNCVQLHEEIEVTYLVDHYCAKLLSWDDSAVMLEGCGPTIHDALVALDRQCEGRDWQDIRKMKPIDRR